MILKGGCDDFNPKLRNFEKKLHDELFDWVQSKWIQT